jgi:hypothetical protein
MFFLVIEEERNACGCAVTFKAPPLPLEGFYASLHATGSKYAAILKWIKNVKASKQTRAEVFQRWKPYRPPGSFAR